MSERLCCFCTNFNLDMGQPAYSEWTPGSMAIIECVLSPRPGGPQGWEMNNGDGVDVYREHIAKAATCPFWKPIEVTL